MLYTERNIMAETELKLFEYVHALDGKSKVKVSSTSRLVQ